MSKSLSTTSHTPSPGAVRLNKFIAECGVASRRKADALILNGEVKVNGRKVYELGIKVDPKKDSVSVAGQVVTQAAEDLYIMFFKPKNVVTTMSDPEGRPCVADYIKNLPQRVFPVGRLDWETEGLLLLTNDGDFANKVMHPAHEITKTYLAKIDGHLEPDAIEKLLSGISILGGRVRAKSIQKVRKGADQYGWYRIVITEGKNRQIHRMFEKIGYDVLKLQRVAIGTLELGGLERGEFRFLMKSQIEKIFKAEEDPKPSRLRYGLTKTGVQRNLAAHSERRQKRVTSARSDDSPRIRDQYRRK